MNLVSILMPVKNAAPFLQECIESIISQTYQEWELLAVDDHSNDESRKILSEMASEDSRIYFLTNPGQGIISSLSHAFRHANGRFVTRIDADDLMTPDRLEKMRLMLLQCDPKTIVTGYVEYFGEQPISEGYKKYEQWLNEINRLGKQWEQVYRECVIASPNWMVYREGITEIGGFDQLTYPEDYHMVLKWYEKGFDIQVIPETTLHWREHLGRTSRTSPNYQQEAFFRLKIKHFIQHQLKKGPLVLWGNNEKTKVTGKVLTESGISYIQLDFLNYRQTEKFHQPRILIGVYPEVNERKLIEKYLTQLGLLEGINWWYV